MDFAHSAESFRNACGGGELDGCGELARLLTKVTACRRTSRVLLRWRKRTTDRPNAAAGCVVLGKMKESGEYGRAESSEGDGTLHQVLH